MILTDGPKAIPFAPLPLEWLEPEMLKAIPASPAHLWTYLWSLTEHRTGTLPKGKVYTHADAARKLGVSERTIGPWFAAIEASGWMESVRLHNGLRYRLRRVPPPGQPTGSSDRKRASDPSAPPPDQDRQPTSDPSAERQPTSDPSAAAAEGSEAERRENRSPLPITPDTDSERFRESERGGGRSTIVVVGGQDSTPPAVPPGPPPADRPPPVTPPASKKLAGDAVARTDRVVSELREYLGGIPLDPGVRRTIADTMGGRSLAAQREIVLTAAATLKQEGFKYLNIPQVWHDRLVEATSTVERRQRQREAALFKGYDPNDPRYPPPTQSEKAREDARTLLYRKAPTMLGEWDPVTRRTVPAPVSLRPVSDSFTTIRDTVASLPQLRPPAPPAEGDVA